MAKFSPINDVIEDAITLDLANPGYAISVKEQSLKNAAIRLGTMDYYRCWPMKVRMTTVYSATQTTGTITFDEVFAKGIPAIPEEQLPYAYFLGVMRVNRPSWNQRSNPNMFDRRLIGVQLDAGQMDILKSTLAETYEDLSTGQPQYEINRTNSTINVMHPFGLGQLIWDFGIGFTTPEYCEMAKVDFLCTFISYRFIESIIQARSGVKLDADFEISTEALEKRLEYLRTKVDDIKLKALSHLGQWS